VCRRRLEGTGFVYAAQHVMTNAHVVAGVRKPKVLLEDGRSLDATIVLYDPRRDVAVLYVPGLQLAPLSFAGEAASGASAVVAGYPGDGPFTAVAARVRGAERARGSDIYQRSQVTREIYSLRARVRPGNSGGPLLAPSGDVYGVVFAAAVDNSDTGYALTAGEVRSDADRGQSAVNPVSSGGCD
jgi:S1-C subfamily serine protease